MEALAVEGDDAGRFLAAMLQRVQAERGDGGGVGMAEDAEDAAFLAQRVAVEIEVRVGARVGQSVFVSSRASWLSPNKDGGAERGERLGEPELVGTAPVDVT